MHQFKGLDCFFSKFLIFDSSHLSLGFAFTVSMEIDNVVFIYDFEVFRFPIV